MVLRSHWSRGCQKDGDEGAVDRRETLDAIACNRQLTLTREETVHSAVDAGCRVGAFVVVEDVVAPKIPVSFRHRAEPIGPPD